MSGFKYLEKCYLDRRIKMVKANKCQIGFCVDATGTTSRDYNDAGELTDLNTPQGDLDYEWRNNGQHKKITEPGSITNTFTYDSYGRPETLTKTDGVWSDVTEWDYDAYGRVNKQTLGNGTWEDYTYDSRSRLDSVTVKKAGPTTLHSQSMVYDEMGNMVSRTENGITTEYHYDFMDRLIIEDRNPSGTTNDYYAEYTYDENGNRLTRDVAVAGGSNVATAYTYDDADKLLSYTKGGTGYSYTYDDAGRPTSVPVIGSSNRTLVWDYDSHLKTWSAPGGGSAIFTNNYNGAGTRISSVVTGGNTQIDLRAGVGQTAPLLKSDNSSVSDVNYVPGISEKRGSTWTWNHSGLKNVDAQTQASPSATSATRTYDAFGNVVTSSGSHVGPFGYGGKFGYQEDSVGYKLLGDRWYDPEVGRFLTRDKAHDGANWYVYCDNNPLASKDSTGNKPEKLDDSAKQAVQEAIDQLRRDGETDAAKKLQELLNAGKILYDPDRVTGDNAFDAAHRESDGAIILGAVFFSAIEYGHSRLTRRYYLAATLLHEYGHSCGDDQVEAYDREIRYLRSLLRNLIAGDKKNVQAMIDSMQSRRTVYLPRSTRR